MCLFAYVKRHGWILDKSGLDLARKREPNVDMMEISERRKLALEIEIW